MKWSEMNVIQKIVYFSSFAFACICITLVVLSFAEIVDVNTSVVNIFLGLNLLCSGYTQTTKKIAIADYVVGGGIILISLLALLR